MEGVSSEEIVGYNKALLEKMDRQIKLNENIENELKKINERLEQTETARVEAGKQKQAEEQARIDRGEQTTEEKSLTALENLTKVIQEQPPSSDDAILKELEKLNSSYSELKTSETTKQVQKLVTTISKDYEGIKLQTSVINSYGLLFIPAILIILFLHNLLKEFI
ncbi:hypothetical protein [Streptococcus thermophilus]|uniref:hypothetical protein n=1 Tax=Streptococcus thermophilus TaxID=1308 RepID=UPI00000B60A0|nr:hypothetical protein [Streptococcus thermophilus]MBO1154263.1 hypothetical protein [Streptococcus thermophilus]CAB46545.1 hypothetical protein [Streptococcus thermophilus]